MTPELRELLELSAKAMGYEVLDRRADDGEWIWVWDDNEKTDKAWLPHLDKAQCFDMECALEIDVEWLSNDYFMQARCGAISCCENYFDHNNDHAKARMMASLRVAAEIGRRMQG